jgi:hypothetical protein
MPKPAKEKDDPKIEDLPGFAFAVPAQRNVEIVSEPGIEGDMPATEELGIALGAERLVEVDGKLDSHHPRGT